MGWMRAIQMDIDTDTDSTTWRQVIRETDQHKECCNDSGFVEHLFELVAWSHQEAGAENNTRTHFTIYPWNGKQVIANFYAQGTHS